MVSWRGGRAGQVCYLRREVRLDRPASELADCGRPECVFCVPVGQWRGGRGISYEISLWGLCYLYYFFGVSSTLRARCATRGATGRMAGGIRPRHPPRRPTRVAHLARKVELTPKK